MHCKQGSVLLVTGKTEAFTLTFWNVNRNSPSSCKGPWWGRFHWSKNGDLSPIQWYVTELWGGLHLIIVTMLKEQNSWAVFFFLFCFVFKKCSGLFVEMQDFYENSFCMEIFVILFINKIRTHVSVRGVRSSMNGSACAPPTFGENYFYQEKGIIEEKYFQVRYYKS